MKGTETTDEKHSIYPHAKLAVHAGNPPDRFACPRSELTGLLVEQQVIVTKMRSAHVPVKILRGCLRTEIRRCSQGASLECASAFLRVSFAMGMPS